jgi:hypothetical protein
MATLQEFYDRDASPLRNEERALFQDKLLSFRTELKLISEQFSMSLKN